MIGLGTIINIITVLIGGGLGTLFGGRLPARMRETVINGLGMFTIALGVLMFTDSQNPIIVLGSVLIGGILGEWWRIDDRLQQFGGWLEKRLSSSSDAAEANRFIKGYVTASLIFCIGPMTVVGSIQDGISGDFTLLAIKSVLDGFAALAFAATLGIGVLFSVVTIFIFQGGLTLFAVQAQGILTELMIAEMTATGGLLVMGIGIGSLLELRQMRVGNFLPAIFLAPLVVAFVPSLPDLLP